MVSLTHSRVLSSSLSGFVICIAAFAFACIAVQAQVAQPSNASQSSAPATVTLHWGARPGVYRYRLQLANDASFNDIVFDRVVVGLEYRVTELAAGKYFWRVAPVDSTFNPTSSAGVIEIKPATNRGATPAIPKPSQSPLAAASKGGWYAAIANATTPLVAHIRSLPQQDLLATTSDGRLVALDGFRGIELWSVRLNAQASIAPVLLKSPNGLDNVAVFTRDGVRLFDGRTGRVLWQSALPAVAASALAVNGKIFVVDNSLQRIFVIGGGGQVVAQAQLARRVVGAPASLELEPRSVMVVLDDGRIQVIDEAGKVVRTGSAQSEATTAPVFVRSTRGTFVLVGTKDGLTALNATDLRPLGRITLKDDTPRGALAAVDIDRDRNPEVVMLTGHGRVYVVKSDEGRTLWEADARSADAVTFADVDGDGALDVLMMSREGFAFALSGRDGSLAWKEADAAIVANHAPAVRSRSIVVAQTNSGALLISTDAGRGGLRAIQFPLVTSRP